MLETGHDSLGVGWDEEGLGVGWSELGCKGVGWDGVSHGTRCFLQCNCRNETPTHRKQDLQTQESILTRRSPDGVLPSPERDAGATPIGSVAPEATEAGKNEVDAEGLRDSRAVQKQ
jgi:hypothetical protein